ncbi:hypothetical protein MYAM1_000449 [Malassezia yamatoensis]|uniref:CCHC-type domain-containing protein n=1 Tax=Malassezia yamatoensis TaxID=253288 RepID=A0AAJ5YR77_9BASI|nr:hypothetical protein MYAM1_000449 [Malassezia yamatoensis]
MTRYTKLEGRRSVPHGSTAPSSDSEAPHTDDMYTDEKIKRRNDDDHKGDALDPKKLLKRVKLLRLKAKKANSEEAKAKYLDSAKHLEQQASHNNGVRGRLGKRKSDDASLRRAQRPRLNADQKAEFRRQMRAQERNLSIRCFVCRETGHSAKECPQNVGEGLASSSMGEVDTLKRGKDTVGICFRCGSTEHSLAKCRKNTNAADNFLPYATCYICVKTGHLASKCPKNQGRGVYPDGGSCKVCNSVDHLAKDCPLDPRRTSAAHSVQAGGVGILDSLDQGGGADDDEFHQVARHRAHNRANGSLSQPRKPAKKVVSL